MILDELDIEILRRAYKVEKDMDLWKWVKEIFPKIKKNKELSKKYILILSRLKRMNIFFYKTENGGSKYILDLDAIKKIEKYLLSKKNIIIEISDYRFTIFEKIDKINY